MEDKENGNNKDLIDQFTFELSLSGANNITQPGKEQLATFALSYHIQCMNLPDCPPPSLSPTSKYIKHTFLYFYFAVKLFICLVAYASYPSYLLYFSLYNSDWTTFSHPDVMTVVCNELRYFLYNVHKLFRKKRSKELRCSLYSVHIYFSLFLSSFMEN